MSSRAGSGAGDLMGPAISFALILGMFWALKPKQAPAPLAPPPPPPPPPRRAITSGWGVGQAVSSPAVAACFDAVRDMQVCAAVAQVLANEWDSRKLREFGIQLLNDGFAVAANAVTDKADRIDNKNQPSDG